MNLVSVLLERRRLVLATAMLLALAGVLSWVSMPREEDPQFPRRNGLILTYFPGADAETVERLVVEPIEENLAEVQEVAEVFTTARAGVSIMQVELHEHIYATDEAWDEVQDALDDAQAEFPEGVSPPRLDDDLVSQEAIVLAITGSTDPLVLVDAAELMKRRLLGLTSVKQVKITADPGEQITIEYDGSMARRLGVDPALLGHQLAQRSRIVPGGVVQLGDRTATLRPQTEFSSLEEIRETPVLLPSGASVPLGELARVRRGPAEPPGERMRWGGEPAVGLGIIPQDGLDRVKFGEEVRAILDELRPELDPLVVDEVVFQPDMVQARLADLTGSLRLGILIVAVVLFVTMGIRLGLLVALVLPLVTFGSIAIFATGGGVLHQISIAALVIALGMLVDNAIVVVENIQWRLDRGLQIRQAAVEAVRSLALPLGAATGTTLAAFVPMLVSTGGTADFTRSIPILIMLTLSVSYIFAITVTPVLSELVLRRRHYEGSNRSERFATGIGHFAVSRAPIVLVGAVALLFLTLLAAGRVDQEFFPAADRNILFVDLEMPEGTHLDVTDAAAQKLENELLRHGAVESLASFIGRASPHFYYNVLSKPDSPHRAQLVAQTHSVETIDDLGEWVRSFAHQEMPEVEVVARRLAQGPPINAPIVVRILGHDLTAMETAADEVLATLRSIPGTRDTRHDLDFGVPSLVFRIDDAAAARHGLSRTDVAQALRGRTLGQEIGQFRTGEDPVPILVRSRAGENFPVEDLDTVDISTPGGDPVPLAQLARTSVEWRPAAIHHFDRSRAVHVEAQLAEGITAHRVLQRLEPKLAELDLPAGVRLELAGELEESGRANDAILRAMPLGVLMLLFFLLAEFNSFRRVGIVLVTVPLAATGVVPGLLLSGNPFGFMSMLGVISLVGIVVNNAIVLLDVVEALREEGFPMDEALIEAIRRRTRPIVLTMTTTVAGLSPLAFSTTSLWPPLAWAMISGLIASTVLTLLVVPALYKVLFTEWTLPGWPWRRTSSSEESEEESPEPAGAVARSTPLVLLLLISTATAPRGLAESAISIAAENPVPIEMTLEEAVEQALERPSGEATRLQVEAALLRAQTEWRASHLPTVGVQLDIMRRDRDYDFATPLGSFVLGDRTSDSAAVSIEQPLFEPSSRLYGIRAARTEARAEDENAQRQRQRLAGEAAEAFFQVLALDARLEATTSFIESLDARLRETEGRVQAGRSLEADALKVRLDLESAQLDRERLLAQRRLALLRLGVSVGHPGPVEPQFDQNFDRPEDPGIQELTSLAFDTRQDARALAERDLALDLRAEAVRAERLPRLVANASWAASNGDPFRPEELVQGGLVLTWTPFAAGTRGSRQAEFLVLRDAVRAEFEELRRGIALEVQGALLDLGIARSAARVRLRGLELARETLRVERERHEAGRATTNDLLTAEASLRRQQTTAELAKIDILRAWAQVDLAVGRVPFLGQDRSTAQ